MSKLKENSIKEVQKLYEAIKASKCVVALTGAGISVPSGIPDFRGEAGLYKTKYGDYKPEVMLSRDFFDDHPDEFFKFYREKMIYADAKPNAAHLLLAELERQGKLSCVITQNIDGLHSDAGSKRVYELHGSVRRNRCMRCGRSYPGTDIVTQCSGVPRCGCGGMIKPDVVLYGEWLDGDVVRGASKAVCDADMLLVIGTSLQVSSASSLLYDYCGDTLAFVNKGGTPYDDMADIIIDDDCAAVAKELLKLL